MSKTTFSGKFTKRQQESLRKMGFEPYYEEPYACARNIHFDNFYIWNGESFYDVVDNYVNRFRTSFYYKILDITRGLDGWY